MLIPFFDFGNNHNEGSKSLAGKPYSNGKESSPSSANKSRESKKGSVADFVDYPRKMFKALYTLMSTCMYSDNANVTFYKAWENVPWKIH